MAGILIGYGRVSTTDQDTGVQEEQLLAAGCTDIYLEQISGNTRNRPKLIEAMKFARKGDTFVVTRIDRLGRSVLDLLDIINELAEKGVVFKTTEQSIDTSNPDDPTAKLILLVFAWVAEMETTLRRDRQRDGIDRAQKEVEAGKRIWKGRGNAYDIDMEDVLAKIESGISKTAIAKGLGITRTTLYRRMRKHNQSTGC